MTGVQVQRHRTAMTRYTLSQPISLAVRHGIVCKGIDVFDYGCGQGDDLRALAAAGIAASGWDPHFAADQPIRPADVVNLGFVLNVIEDLGERDEALTRAWGIARAVLLVSVMLVGAVPVDGLRRFGDGFLTSRGTFQRYYQHNEIREVVSRSTGTEPVALAPGIFAAFRSPEREQDLLFERRRGRRASVAAFRFNRPRKDGPRRVELHERIARSLEALSAFMVDRGRAPHADEITADIHEEIVRERVSFERAVETARSMMDDNAITAAADSRREDLVVHAALGMLSRTRLASRLSPSLTRDIRCLFGSQQELGVQALDYLHALTDPQRTVEAMRESARAARGIIDEDGRFLVRGDAADALGGTLRCYVGCGMHLVGEIEEDHLVRLEPEKRRLVLFTLANKTEPFPKVDRSIIVDLRRQDVTVRPENRTLVRKADVFGLGMRTRQRMLEAKLRNELGLDPTRAMIRL